MSPGPVGLPLAGERGGRRERGHEPKASAGGDHGSVEDPINCPVGSMSLGRAGARAQGDG